jgi:uncharacterized coiled-coil DUF342 family protein
MPEPSSADRIQQFRAKAKELREKAATLRASEFREQLLDIAREYDELADAVQRRLYRS